MIKSRALIGSLVSAALFWGTSAQAQVSRGDIDKIFNWAKLGTPGCAVAASQNGKPVVQRAYGSADLERAVPLTPGSVFDAGSLVKQFVAAAVLILVEEGKLSLSDDVRTHIPELPDFGHIVTLDHLLTHTSGVREWQGIAMLGSGQEDALTLVLRQRTLDFAPGEKWSYSNGGYVLLREVVTRKSGVSLEEFAQKRLFEPLGMGSTAYLNDLRQIVKNRALAFAKVGNNWRMDVKLDADRGGGGALLSNTADLLTWNDALTNLSLGTFVTSKLQEPARLNSGRKLGYARGLFTDEYRGLKRVWHSSNAGAYHSWLGRFPDQGLSVAVMCNSSEVEATDLGRRLADQFLPTADSKDDHTPDVGTSAAAPDVSGRAGLFFSEHTGEPLRLVANNGRLRIPGASAPLVTVSNDRFLYSKGEVRFMSQDEFELRFLSPDRLEMRSAEGNIVMYRRAVSYAPSVTDLKAFGGIYRSGETNSSIDVKPKEGLLLMRLEHRKDDPLNLKLVDRDTFEIGPIFVRFVRDKGERVVALDLSTPVVTKIRFTRATGTPK